MFMSVRLWFGRFHLVKPNLYVGHIAALYWECFGQRGIAKGRSSLSRVTRTAGVYQFVTNLFMKGFFSAG